MTDAFRWTTIFLFFTGATLVSGCLEDFTLAKDEGGGSDVSDIDVDSDSDTNPDTADSDSSEEFDTISDSAIDSQIEEDTATDSQIEEDTATDSQIEEDTATDSQIEEDTATDSQIEEDTATDSQIEEDSESESFSDTTEDPPDPIIYVSAKSPASSPNGLSWQTAYRSVQKGIDMAFLRGSGVEEWQVWVAAGTYSIHSGDPTDTVTLRKKVHVYGGFEGDEDSLEERNFRLNETILDGSTKIYHVVLGEDDAVIDGFTIRGGNANGPEDITGGRSGGGVYAQYRSPTIRNCKITNNTATFGGGISTKQSASLIENCIISNNVAERGGGLYTNSTVEGRPITVVNTVFIGNTGTVNGGATYSWGSDPFFINCTIVGNSTSGNGGGICGYENSSPFVKNSVLWANTASGTGPQYHVNYTSSITVLYSNIQDNVFDAFTGCTGGDPNFVSESVPYDLRLVPPSAAIDQGTNIDAPATDIQGNPRPLGSGYDMGAYEYNPN